MYIYAYNVGNLFLYNIQIYIILYIIIYFDVDGGHA